MEVTQKQKLLEVDVSLMIIERTTSTVVVTLHRAPREDRVPRISPSRVLPALLCLEWVSIICPIISLAARIH